MTLTAEHSELLLLLLPLDRLTHTRANVRFCFDSSRLKKLLVWFISESILETVHCELIAAT